MQPVKLYWLHPLPLGVLAAIFLLASGGIAWTDMVLAGTMIFLGILSGHRLSMRQQRAIAIAIDGLLAGLQTVIHDDGLEQRRFQGRSQCCEDSGITLF